MRLERPHAGVRRVILAPLVDVLLILLIFFMVTSTYADLDLRPVVGPEPYGVATTQAGPVVVTLLGDGELRLRGSEAELSTLAAMGREVVLLPSGAASVGQLVAALNRMEAAGLGTISLVRPGRAK
ncbi:MAG: biopolymer transporter ExbD [Paracoccaceae bacterium]|nr:biopolymer transporter ExbD [Paracoccaceae bacterium]